MKDKFISLIAKFSKSDEFNEACWNELVRAYSHPSRFYHNLTHLENMLLELDGVKETIVDLDAVLFALFYHDIIYDAKRTDNEEQSALLFIERASQTEFAQIERSKKLIEATKGHNKSDDLDTNLFLDMDLSILGQTSDVYTAYCNQIRKEYHMYPNEVYRAGRKKVLAHFLESDSIYNTDFFKQKYEQLARKNMQAELAKLS